MNADELADQLMSESKRSITVERFDDIANNATTVPSIAAASDVMHSMARMYAETAPPNTYHPREMDRRNATSLVLDQLVREIRRTRNDE